MRILRRHKEFKELNFEYHSKAKDEWYVCEVLRFHIRIENQE